MASARLDSVVPAYAEAALWYAAATLATLANSFAIIFNGDIWYHLAAGRLIWASRAVPRVDSWSYTMAGRPWINHEWLSDLIFFGWSRLFGIESLVVCEWLLLIATFLLLFKVLHRLSSSYAASFLVLIFVVATAAPFFDVRPYLWTLLGFVMVVRLALMRERPSWLLPIVFALWANLHGGFVFGLAALGCCFGAAAIAARAGDPSFYGRRFGIVTATSFAATIINPYGLKALAYPLRLLQSGSASRELIAEWKSPLVAGGINSPLYFWAIGACAIASLVVIFAYRGDRRLLWSALALSFLTLLMSIESRRFITLFAIGSSLTLALGASVLLRRFESVRLSPSSSRWLSAALAAAAIVALAVHIRPYPWSNAFLYTTAGVRLPVGALDYIEANGLDGRIFAYYSLAGYVDFRTDGKLQVFIDPRAETVFDSSVLRNYHRVQRLMDGWQQILEGSGAQWVLAPPDRMHNGRLVTALLSSRRWRVFYEDAVSVLLGRSVSAQTFPLEFAAALRDRESARSASGRGDLREAERLLTRSLEEKPDLIEACFDLVEVEDQLGEAEAATRTAGRCRSISGLPAQ